MSTIKTKIVIGLGNNYWTKMDQKLSNFHLQSYRVWLNWIKY